MRRRHSRMRAPVRRSHFVHAAFPKARVAEHEQTTGSILDEEGTIEFFIPIIATMGLEVPSRVKGYDAFDHTRKVAVEDGFAG